MEVKDTYLYVLKMHIYELNDAPFKPREILLPVGTAGGIYFHNQTACCSISEYDIVPSGTGSPSLLSIQGPNYVDPNVRRAKIDVGGFNRSA